ncbi:TadE/TadG family type IV pilus assembly protein [Chlorobium sp. N1]|uniref:TadE/TadG family type IV pilus assembly protein n=1 Tax=Chlorobium sp. N1 TaxID=2491138 RepID=UPI00103DF011|nr:TadE/TadG family type IV pilus assembly protein [Chlorobium sp. N1]TCD47226.1 pilus assembly protein [Chlorobium sp. N1]
MNAPEEQCRREKGSVIVEFALILPLFLLLAFGMVTVSVALYDKTVLTMASREGARTGIRYVAGRTEAGITGSANAAALELCRQNLISFGGTMTPSATSTVSGDILTVEVSGTYTGIYLFGDMQISSRTSMRIE